MVKRRINSWNFHNVSIRWNFFFFLASFHAVRKLMLREIEVKPQAHYAPVAADPEPIRGGHDRGVSSLPAVRSGGLTPTEQSHLTPPASVLCRVSPWLGRPKDSACGPPGSPGQPPNPGGDLGPALTVTSPSTQQSCQKQARQTRAS